MSKGTTPPKIKILFLGANPSDTTRLALGKEVREITQRLRAAHQGERFEFVQEWAVRIGDLQAALLRHRPQIVHFSGHGQGEASTGSTSSRSLIREMLPINAPSMDARDGEILIEDDGGRAKPIPGSALASLFEIVGSVQCVVLNACHSAAQAEAIRQHVDAVIAMRRSIDDAAAVNFAWAFYQGLAFGESLNNAFKLGKNQIELAGFGDGDVPKLLTREKQSHIRDSVNESGADPFTRSSGNDVEERVDPFLAHVERVAKLRHAGARITRSSAPRPFAGVLKIEVDAGGFFRTSIVAAVDLAITKELIEVFFTEIDQPLRESFPQLRSMLVHRGNAAPIALRASLDRRGIELQTFDSYQGLFDLGPYLEWQTRDLEKNPAYLPSAYVDPPGWIKIAGNRELQHTDNALETISELLATQAHRRFLLVLGEFGAGKTFLLRELCRQMVKTNHPVLPVLLEMSKLEKQHSLAELLGAHFARADVPGYNFKAFEYMLGEGRIALFFDGFDELADKVTYDSATQHLDTVLSAAQGQAKVVLSSRRQHFLTEGDIHKAVEREFARKAESAVQGGYRLIMLQPFAEPQIRRYLRNVLVDEAAAEARYRLLDEVKDLIGLSHNPRMLSFISAIPEASLRQAKEQWGEITAAKLYELLVKQWLDFEHDRSRRQGSSKGISRQALLRGVESLALSMWQSRATVVLVGEIHEGIAQALVALGEPALDAAVLAHIFGSGSLLVRDEEGRFSFVHRSVMEWLVAKQAADELIQGQDPPALVADEMSALMADFFAAMAGRERAAIWARNKLANADEGVPRKNAALLLTRMGERFERVSFEGQDLRGKDFSGVDWRGANLRGVDLRGATLKGADLRKASLAGADLSHADLRGANLAGVDFAEADLSFVRAENADFSMAAPLDPIRFRGAKLLWAKGIPDELHGAFRSTGAVPSGLRHVEPMYAAGTRCRSVAFRHDGSLLAMVHENGIIKLVDAVAGNVLRIISGHVGEVRWIVFAPDDETFASTADDRTVRLWDAATGRLLRVFEGHEAMVCCVAFAPDGKTFASGSNDGVIRLWEAATGHVLRAFQGHRSGVTSVAFSPDGKSLASAAKSKTIRLWEIATGDSLQTFKEHRAITYSIAFAPDAKTLAAGFVDQTVWRWDIATGRVVHTFKSPFATYSAAFAPDGKILTIGSNDGTSNLWGMATNLTLEELVGHAHHTWNMAFAPDDNTLRNRARNHIGRLSRTAKGRSLREFEGHASVVRSVAFSPDGKSLAVGAEDTTVRLWNATAGGVEHAFGGHADSVWSVAFSPNGRTLASGSSDKTIRLWDAATGRTLRTFEGHADAVYSLAFAPDATMLASASYDKAVRLWNVASGAQSVLNGHTLAVYSVAFAPNGKTLASGSYDTTVRLWDVAKGGCLRIFKRHLAAVLSVAFAPNDNILASGSSDKTIRLWSVDTGMHLRAFEGHTAPVRSVAFSTDGISLASGSDDRTVQLWNVATGRTIRTFEGHMSPVRTVAFSPDGKTLASGSYDNTVRLWDIATGQCLAILLATPEGWVAFTPDGRYKFGGNIAGSFWHVAGLCRFEPGELDEYLNLRLPDDALFLPAKP